MTAARRPRLPARLAAAPLRLRLVAGFCAAMALVLVAAGAFVYWRVEYALDRELDGVLAEQADALGSALGQVTDPSQVLDRLPPASGLDQVVGADGALLASRPLLPRPLLGAADLARARAATVRRDRGNLLLDRDRRLRVLARPGPGGTVALTAVRLGQRDEALRELLAQLAAAGSAALLAAGGVGWLLARSALRPVDRYRAAAERVTAGDRALRLTVPDRDDEVARLGRTLNDLLDAQERAAERERRFVVDAGHELRTPLALLAAEVELALRRPRGADELEAVLRDVAVDVDRLAALAGRLLDQDAAGGADAPAAVGPALQRAADRARRQLPDGRRVAVEATTAASASCPLPEHALDLVLGNLVDNAVRHGAGTVTLTGTLTGTLPDDDVPGWLRLAVHDEGEGPPQEIVPELTERFRRGDAARTGPGAGLGLSLVQQVVTAAGGQLRLCCRSQHHAYGAVAGAPACPEHPGGTTVTALLPADAGAGRARLGP